MQYILRDCNVVKVRSSNIHHTYFSARDGIEEGRNGIKFPRMENYGHSKLANVLHTKELARQLLGSESHSDFKVSSHFSAFYVFSDQNF